MCWKNKQANPTFSKVSHEQAEVIGWSTYQGGPSDLEIHNLSLGQGPLSLLSRSTSKRVRGWNVSILIMAESLDPNL